MNNIPKCKITTVGSFDKHGNPIGWVFKYPTNCTTPYTSMLWGGYTPEELHIIHEVAARAEVASMCLMKMVYNAIDTGEGIDEITDNCETITRCMELLSP